MRFHLSISLLLCLCFNWSIAQSKISGSIKDRESGEPIFGAIVFIENTKVGTTTDPDGNFELGNIPTGFNKLVVSHVGYKNYSGQLSGKTVLNIQLRPDVRQLAQVDVTQKQDRQWKRLYAQFEKVFLGNTINGKQSKILNPWVVELSKDKDGKVWGYSTDLIQIENRGTGYQIDFLLEKLEMLNNQVTYSGKPLFKDLEPKDAAERKRWKNNRKRTYSGSKQQFIYALMNDQLEELGFEVYKAQIDHETKGFKTLQRLTADKLYSNGEIKFSEFIRIVYKNEDAEAGYQSDANQRFAMPYDGPDHKMVRGGIAIQNGPEGTLQVSYLFNRASKVFLNENGLIKNPEYLLEYGYWGWERIGELLPNEYHLELIGSSAEEAEDGAASAAPTKNGFVLSNLLVDKDDLVSGNVEKNGIPAISSPKFEDATSNSWLGKKDMVLGVEFNGEARAYPISILDRHEAVNDEFNGVPVLITYCPLCGSGMAFNPSVEGKKMTFGVSGLLYNSDVLLYDNETQSLWSQIESKAISGEMSGRKLEHLPTYHMSWPEWKSKFPNGKVMTKETGFDFDYGTPAYKGYDKSPQILFPVKDQNPYLSTKELVIGVTINGKHKSYTLKKLRKLKKAMEDELGGKKIFITYLSSSNSAVIHDENGNVVPSTRLFWFAWYAFHPDTEVY